MQAQIYPSWPGSASDTSSSTSGSTGGTHLGMQLHKLVAQQAVHALHSAGVRPEGVVHARKVDVCRGEGARQGRG
jgi:hypothetical protein